MKSTIKLFKIIAMTAIIGFSISSCGGNDSGKSKFEGIFDGVGVWNATASNGDQLEMSFTDDSKFTLGIDELAGSDFKVAGGFTSQDDYLTLVITGYYDFSTTPPMLVNFDTATPTEKQKIEDKLNATFGGNYKEIRYKFENGKLIILDASSNVLLEFEKNEPPPVTITPEVPSGEVIDLTVPWLNDHDWTVGKPGTWSAYECKLTSALNVPSGRVLKILPATTITFTQAGGSLTVQSGGGIEAEGSHVLKDQSGKDVTYNGSLVSGRIVLKSSGLTKGSWSGIAIQSNYANVLDYVEIKNAGRNTTYPPISITAGNSASITNSIIDGSTTNGIRITGTNSVLTAFDNNTIKNCDLAPIYAAVLWSLRNISKNNTYDTTNTINHIEISNYNSGLSASDTMTIKNIGIPYYFSAGLQLSSSGSTLNIEAGVEILVGNNVEFIISSGSKLVAIGTDQQPITFKPLVSTAAKGYWDGITFNSSGNELDYVEIKNAGRKNGAMEFYPILIKANSSVSITNSIIDGSNTNGIFLDTGSSVLTAFDNSTIKNCDYEPIHTEYLWSLRNIGKNNTYDTTNGTNHIDIGNLYGNISNIPDSNNMTIKNIGIPYYFSYGLDHSATNSTLTIEAGVEILVNNARNITIGANSKLVAIGTLLDRIKIRGLTDDKGYWRGVNVSSSTEGTKFAYCDISGGGNGGTSNACLVISNNAYAQLQDVKLSKSTTHGLRLSQNARIWAHSVTFEDIDGVYNVWEYATGSPGYTEFNTIDREDFAADPL